MEDPISWRTPYLRGPHIIMEDPQGTRMPDPPVLLGEALLDYDPLAQEDRVVQPALRALLERLHAR